MMIKDEVINGYRVTVEHGEGEMFHMPEVQGEESKPVVEMQPIKKKPFWRWVKDGFV